MKINKKALYKAIGSIVGIIVLILTFIWAHNNYGIIADKIVFLVLLYVITWLIIYSISHLKKFTTYIASCLILFSTLAYFYPILIIIYFFIVCLGSIVYCLKSDN
jgi:hypothetical protein